MRSNPVPVVQPLRLACLALLLTAAPALAQTAASPQLPAPSPAARVDQRVGVTDFVVRYSSPAVKGREIWGGLVPYDKVWRTGANAATTLEASTDFTFGGVAVPAGTYALYTIPGKGQWTVVLNTNAKASGTRDYDETKNIASVKVKPESAPKRERMTFLFSDATDTGVRLDLEWAALRVAIPLGVDTAGLAKKNIDAALDDAWRPHFSSARWLLDSGGDLGKALAYIDTSIAIKETWWNHWVKAQILAKKGDKAGAVAMAEKAGKLGKGDEVYEGFFRADVDKAIASWK